MIFRGLHRQTATPSQFAARLQRTDDALARFDVDLVAGGAGSGELLVRLLGGLPLAELLGNALARLDLPVSAEEEREPHEQRDAMPSRIVAARPAVPPSPPPASDTAELLPPVPCPLQPPIDAASAQERLAGRAARAGLTDALHRPVARVADDALPRPDSAPHEPAADLRSVGRTSASLGDAMPRDRHDHRVDGVSAEGDADRSAAAALPSARALWSAAAMPPLSERQRRRAVHDDTGAEGSAAAPVSAPFETGERVSPVRGSAAEARHALVREEGAEPYEPEPRRRAAPDPDVAARLRDTVSQPGGSVRIPRSHERGDDDFGRPRKREPGIQTWPAATANRSDDSSLPTLPSPAQRLVSVLARIDRTAAHVDAPHPAFGHPLPARGERDLPPAQRLVSILARLDRAATQVDAPHPVFGHPLPARGERDLPPPAIDPPVSGLRRLAALAPPRAEGEPRGESSPCETAPPAFQSADLAARVYDVLRREAERHGIDMTDVEP